jgi:hypothetical protein
MHSERGESHVREWADLVGAELPEALRERDGDGDHRRP